MEPIIEIEGLHKVYDDQTVVKDLNLTIERGEIFGLLGPNGAGKSTTIRMILGLTEPTQGGVKVCGISSSRNPIEVKKHIGYLPEDIGFYGRMSAFENLFYTAQLNGLSEKKAKSRVEDLLLLVGLEKERNKKVDTFSKGMKQRLGLADVLVKKPEVIILDEPTNGLDPGGMKDFLSLIKGLSDEEGISVLFSSHHLHQVQHICSRVGLFVKGKLIATGDVNSLAAKLFGETTTKVQAMISDSDNNKNPENKLAMSLKQIPEVLDVAFQENRLTIDCNKDITPEIAKVIIDNDYKLSYLNRQQYGLDEIYNKYFEGGDYE